MLIDALKLLTLTMANPLSRAVLRAGLGRGLLERALEAYTGAGRPHEPSERLYAALLGLMLSAGARAFGAAPHEMRGYFSDPMVRRGVSSVLRGIARYGVTKPQLLEAPFLVVWNYTAACNLRCLHCYQSAGGDAPYEFSTEERLEAVDELAKAGVVAVALSGGEPLVRPEIYAVLRRIKEHDMYAAVATNGTLITRDVARRLRSIGVDYVEVSIDSPRAEVHNRLRGVSGAFDMAVRGVANCVEAGLYTCIATVITRGGLGDVPGIIGIARCLGVPRIIHFNFIPAGRGAEMASEDLTPEEREELLHLLYEEGCRGGLEVLSTAPQYARVALQESGGRRVSPTHFYTASSDWDLRILAEFIGGCGAGRLYCALQPNGDVTPCVFMPDVVVGNLREEGLLDIWHGSRVMRRLRDRELLKGDCGTCGYRYVCGGCRARARAYTGDLMASDPGCELTGIGHIYPGGKVYRDHSSPMVGGDAWYPSRRFSKR